MLRGRVVVVCLFACGPAGPAGEDEGSDVDAGSGDATSTPTTEEGSEDDAGTTGMNGCADPFGATDCPAFEACFTQLCGPGFAMCYGPLWVQGGPFDGVCAELASCQCKCEGDPNCEDQCNAATTPECDACQEQALAGGCLDACIGDLLECETGTTAGMDSGGEVPVPPPDEG